MQTPPRFNRHNRVAWALLAADTARALIARPHILYLDEATNQLDDAAACRLMQTLKTALPDTLCLASATKRPSRRCLRGKSTSTATALRRGWSSTIPRYKMPARFHPSRP